MFFSFLRHQDAPFDLQGVWARNLPILITRDRAATALAIFQRGVDRTTERLRGLYATWARDGVRTSHEATHRQLEVKAVISRGTELMLKQCRIGYTELGEAAEARRAVPPGAGEPR